MGVIVQKYGGSSVSDIDKIRKVAEKAVETKRAGNQVVVVVSAMGNTTNELIGLAHQLHDAPPRREMDMLVSVGERITIALLSMAMHALGEEAISFTGSQSGIITNDNHHHARIVEVRPFRIQDELERGRLVIVAGYQGVSYKREITTLGRGGTDTTAVALTAALGAERCEIYSDVDGVFSADPRAIPGAEKLEEVTYDEMIALARGGAKVLNAEAVAYAKRHGIAIYAKSTFAGPEKTGTVIRRDLVTERPLAGVATTANALIIDSACDVETFLMLHRFAEQHHILWTHLQHAGERVLGIAPRVDIPLSEMVCGELQRHFGARLATLANHGTVSLVGHCLQEGTRMTRAYSSLHDMAGPVATVLTTHALAAVVPNDAIDNCAARWHSEFF